MNKLFIVGNLTNNPELRTTQDGKTVCTFGVAVNRRRSANNAQPEADFFRISAWNALGENCNKYLVKGKKVAVTGRVSVSTYTTSNGTFRANMEVLADDIEFLSPKQEQQAEQNVPNAVVNAPQNKYVEVPDEELPF